MRAVITVEKRENKVNRNKFFVSGIAITLLLSLTVATIPLWAANKEEIEQQRADIPKMANETLARLYELEPLG